MHPEARNSKHPTQWCAILCAGILLLGLAACDGNGDPLDAVGESDQCNVPTNLFADGGVGKDGIPALTNPDLADPDNATYLANSDRIIGLFINGQPLAVPHNILWWHEINNFDFSNLKLAVTYCPLTGSSMAFDRASVGGGEFGVSGLLFQNNLTMYDRTSKESLWPQMNRQAGCGPRVGTRLEMYPVIEMTWGGWKSLHPDTRVLSSNTGFSRNYTPSGYPYGNYEVPNNSSLLFPQRIDNRRPPKERVLGIPDLGGGIAFPFFELDEQGPYQAVHERVAGQAVVVFWDRGRQGAMAYRLHVDGQDLTFEGRPDGIYDVETGSQWQVDGRAVEGTLAGAQLEPVAEAFVAFWFAWAAFQPDTLLWENTGG